MTFTRNLHHAEDGILKFAAPFWGKPRWAALFVAIARQIQELEDAACDVIEKRMLANATSAQLAVLGGLVGQTDPGLGEETFRMLIRVRIRINRSEGRRDDLIEVLQLLGIPMAQRTLLVDSPPAKYRLHLTGTLPLPIGLLSDLLNQTVSGGVGVAVTWPFYSPGFSYSNNTSVPALGQTWPNNSGSGSSAMSLASAFRY